jgi:hypothetical protein
MKVEQFEERRNEEFWAGSIMLFASSVKNRQLSTTK